MEEKNYEKLFFVTIDSYGDTGVCELTGTFILSKMGNIITKRIYIFTVTTDLYFYGT